MHRLCRDPERISPAIPPEAAVDVTRRGRPQNPVVPLERIMQLGRGATRCRNPARVELEPTPRRYAVCHPSQCEAREVPLGPPVSAADVAVYASEPHLLEQLSRLARAGLLLPESGYERTTALVDGDRVKGTIHATAERHIMESEQVLREPAEQAHRDAERADRIPHADACDPEVGVGVAGAEVDGFCRNGRGVVATLAVQLERGIDRGVPRRTVYAPRLKPNR